MYLLEELVLFNYGKDVKYSTIGRCFNETVNFSIEIVRDYSF